jgi:dTDP-4-dehydrorhamnose 3,5-epimerase
MKFAETRLAGVYVIDLERIADERGFFARTWCRKELESHALETDVSQCSVSFNARRGTLRGMHFQADPYAETKIVRCTMGAIRDVVLDLRPGSSSFGQWVGVDLTADNRRMVYVPHGCAHGFQTLVDATEVFYQITPSYVPEAARGVRWNDPGFTIEWPLPDPILSDRDRSYPDFAP